MKLKKVTVQDILSWDPCDGYTEEKIKELFGRKKYLNVKQILDLDIPAEDRLWVVLRPEMIPEMIIHEFLCQVAESVLPIYEKEYPDDKRPRNAIETKRRWINGEATDEELAAARVAARDAARVAARDAAWVAAWAAARAAARAAAGDAARAAARDAAGVAAWAAARDAAGDAAGVAAWAEQIEILKGLIR